MKEDNLENKVLELEKEVTRLTTKCNEQQQIINDFSIYLPQLEELANKVEEK
jgi:phage host-nuclease inhibitor protein Gam